MHRPYYGDYYFLCLSNAKELMCSCDILLGIKKIETEKEKKIFEAAYFAMCFLLPKEAFLKMAEALGGMEFVSSCERLVDFMADYFKVPGFLVRARIKDLLSQKQQVLENKKLTKTIENHA